MNLLPKILTAILLAMLSCFLHAQNTKKVLLISSYNSRFPTFFNQIKGVRSVLDSSQVQLDLEFMDSKRFLDTKSKRLFTQLLAHKIANSDKYDAVISTDDNALNFVIEQQDSLFKHIPVVFCGVNNLKLAEQQNKNPSITGLVEAVSMEETITTMLHLFPQRRCIYALVDSTNSGQADLKHYYDIGKKMPHIEFKEIALHTLSFQEFARELKTIPDDIPVLLLSAYHDKTKQPVDFSQSLKIINENLNAPLFHLWHHGIGSGIVGGKLISHCEQGKAAASLVKRILEGEQVAQIPVINQSPNVYIFDYNQLKKHHVALELLPQQAQVINLPSNFFAENKQVIFTVLLLFGLLLGFIFILAIHILKRKKIEKKLVEQNEVYAQLNIELQTEKNRAEKNELRFRHLFQNNPVSLWEEDFTAVKNRLEHAKQKHPNIEQFIEENDEFVSTCAAEIKVSNINKSTLRLFEFEDESELTTNLSSIFNRVSFSTFKKLLKVLAQGQQQLISETEFITKTGKVISAMLYIFSFHKNENSIVAIVDTSKLKQTEAELRQINQALSAAKNKAIESDQLKTAFLNNMSHEIRTPMNGILGFAELLNENKTLDKNTKNYLNIIQQSSERLLNIINNMLDIARIETGQIGVFEKETDLSALTEDVLNQFLHDAAQKKLTLSLKKPDTMHKYLLTDSEKLTKILINLVNNAVKFTQSGEIQICYCLQDGFVEFAVSDTGIGIEPALQHAIFERFRQVEVSNSKNYGGTGVGLSICKGLVQAMGGEIWLESEKAKGSTFFFTIPHKPAPR